jgi:3-deoxy-7-phosphoheptulonate synthase
MGDLGDVPQFPIPDGLLDIFHATTQGVIAGANMILVECHPRPEVALCDGPQSLTMQEICCRSN